MPRTHLDIILLAAAVDPVARKYPMTGAELYKCLVEMRPTMADGTLRAAAARAVTAPPQVVP